MYQKVNHILVHYLTINMGVGQHPHLHTTYYHPNNDEEDKL